MAGDDDFLAELSAEAQDLATVPTEAGASRLRSMAVRMVTLQDRIADIEAELKTANVELWDLKTRDMPSLMAELDVDKIGLAESGVDLVMEPYVHANIRADWEEEKREAGFAELDRIDGGNIVKNVVSLQFSRNEAALTQAFMEVLEDAQFRDRVAELVRAIDPDTNHTTLPDAELARAVQWNTLTAFVREQIQRGTVLDLEKLGATVGSIVKIKKRK